MIATYVLRPGDGWGQNGHQKRPPLGDLTYSRTPTLPRVPTRVKENYKKKSRIAIDIYITMVYYGGTDGLLDRRG